VNRAIDDLLVYEGGGGDADDDADEGDYDDYDEEEEEEGVIIGEMEVGNGYAGGGGDGPDIWDENFDVGAFFGLEFFQVRMCIREWCAQSA
jgi:hypothetical protein